MVSTTTPLINNLPDSAIIDVSGSSMRPARVVPDDRREDAIVGPREVEHWGCIPRVLKEIATMFVVFVIICLLVVGLIMVYIFFK